MKCVLLAKMDQGFSLKKTNKKNWKNGEKILEKSGNFVSSEKWAPCKYVDVRIPSAFQEPE